MFWTIAFIVALLFACIAIGWALFLRHDRARIASSLAQQNLELDNAKRDHDEQVTQRQQLATDLAIAREKLNHLEDSQKGLRDTFDALASQSLAKAQQQFLDLAKKSFEGEQKDAAKNLAVKETAIKALVDPIREKLDAFAKHVHEVEGNRKAAYTSVKQQIERMMVDQTQLRSETHNLVKALRQPEVRGRWGEIQLQRLVELAGMIPNCDFEEQVSVKTVDGVQRPDMVVRMPSGRTVVVDAKTPLTGFIDAIETDDDAQRDVHLDRHVRHIEQKVVDLSAKSYQSQFDRSPEFVVLFIPGEPFLEAAVRRKPALIEQAMTRNVIIATPTTLIALLKAVAAGWREEQIADNAKRISDLGIELHKRLSVMAAHAQNLGKAVGKTVEHYNKFVGSLDTQVMVQARRFEEYGASSNKQLPDADKLPMIETAPRPLLHGSSADGETSGDASGND